MAKTIQTSRYNNYLSFIDLLFNLMLGFAAMFLLTLQMISLEKVVKQETEPKNADFIVRMEWQGDHDSDLDLWIRDTKGNIVGYLNKQTSELFLERDNLGTDTDRKVPGHINEEIITIRSAQPGWYTVNVQWYIKREETAIPLVKWSVIRNKPSLKTEFSGETEMTGIGKEQTLIRFRLDENKTIVEVDRSLSPFVLRQQNRRSTQGN